MLVLSLDDVNLNSVKMKERGADKSKSDKETTSIPKTDNKKSNKCAKCQELVDIPL